MLFMLTPLFLLGLYVCYYLTKCRRPKIYAAATSHLPEKLLSCCPAISHVFFPSFIFAQPDLQSLTCELSDKTGNIKLVTTTSKLKLIDGGEISYTEPAVSTGQDKKLIVVIVPGYLGDHKTYYVLHLAQLLHQQGIWPVIFTDRGKGGMAMKTPKFFCAGYNDGLAALLDLVMDSNPNSNFGVVGISFGGMVACNTLSQYHRRSEIVAQILLSAPLDSLKCKTRLTAAGRAKILYSNPFGKKIKKLLSNNEDVFKTKQHKKLFRNLSRSESLTDIDDVFIAPMFGYACSTEYHRNICIAQRLREIDVFTICINAEDDPCFDREMYPVDTIQSNDKVCLISTAAGGHFGFAGFGWPFSSQTYCETILTEIVSMIYRDVT